MNSRKFGLPLEGNRQVQGTGSGRMEERALDGGRNLAFSSLFMDRQDMEDGSRSGVSARRAEDMGAASMMSDSPFMDRQSYRDDAHVQSSSRSLVGGSEAFLPGGSREDDYVSERRHYGAERQSLYGMGGSPGILFSSLFMDRQDMEDGSRSGVSARRAEDMGAASMMSDSPFMDRQSYRDDAHVQSSRGASEAFLPGGSMGHVPVDDFVSERRHYGAERQSLYGMGGSPSLELSSGHVGSSSRSGACKRKSCGPVAPGNMSSRSGSPRRSGYRDGYIGRTGGSNGMSSRTIGMGGSSSSLEIVGSSSTPSDEVFLGRYGEVPAMAEDLVPRRMSFGDESSPDSVRESLYGKSVAGGSSGIPNSQRTRRSGANGVVLNNSGSSPFPRTVRRAIPSHENLPRRTPVPDSSMAEDDLGTSSSGSVFEQMLQRSEGPVVGGGRLRRSEGAFGGDRAMARYLENSTRGGGVGLESRLRSRVLSHHSDLMSQSSQAMLAAMQTAPHPGGPSTPSPSRPPPHPPSLRGRLHGSSLQSLLPPPSASGSAPSRSAPSPPSRMPPKPSSVDPLSFAPSIDSLPSPAALFRGSSMHGSSAAGLRDREFMSGSEGFLRMPFRGLQISAGDGGSQPRLGPEGLAEILLALERVERDEDLTYEQLLMLEATLLFGGMGLHDEHSDMRLDVDNMSYEELLALEERIGNVSTGLTSDAIEQKLQKTRYWSLDAAVARHSQECDIKCSICQEEYEEGDELGKIECGHGYHWQCIQQWLVQKNQCPICKAAAFS